MSMALNHDSIIIILQAVSAIKEFANVSPDVMIQGKVSAGMVPHKRTNIKQHFIKNIQFSSTSNKCLKLFSLHLNIFWRRKWNFLRVYFAIKNLA